MATAQLNSVPSGAAELNPVPSGGVPFGTALAHTWYLTGRKLHALARQPWVLAFSVVQPVIWLFLFGQLFRKVIDIPGFSFGGSYLDYLVPGLIAMNAMSNNMWAGMSMIEEIERGTLNRFLASPASRIGIMNATVAEQAVSTTVQSLIIVGLGLAGGARYHGGVGGVAVMVAASILSITLVPVLMTIFIRGKRLKPESFNPVSRFFTWLYEPVIRLALRWRWPALMLNFAVIPLTIPLLSGTPSAQWPPD